MNHHAGSIGANHASAQHAAMTRVVGFEIMTAPFTIAHWQVGEMLRHASAPFGEGERAAVVRDLTRSLGAHYLLDVPGFYKRQGSKDVRLAGSTGLVVPVRDDEQQRVPAVCVRDPVLVDLARALPRFLEDREPHR